MPLADSHTTPSSPESGDILPRDCAKNMDLTFFTFLQISVHRWRHSSQTELPTDICVFSKPGSTYQTLQAGTSFLWGTASDVGVGGLTRLNLRVPWPSQFNVAFASGLCCRCGRPVEAVYIPIFVCSHRRIHCISDKPMYARSCTRRWNQQLSTPP